jgi:hypothetical protein
MPAPDPQEIPSDLPATDLPQNPLPFENTPQATEMSPDQPAVEKFVSLSKKDLADRLQIAAEGIALLKTAEMIWPNAALGCPAPGKVYSRGTVPGYQIWLEAGGVEYVYNTDLTGQVILCPRYDPDSLDVPIPGTPGPTPHIGVPRD